MALKVLQPGLQPLGQFDMLDTQAASIMGGEVLTLKSVVDTDATDEGASDVFDGYTFPSSVAKRPALTRTLSSGNRPLFLADEGIIGYGTMFGSVVGGTAGQGASPGVALGPSTLTGSGKCTVWDKSGLYAVSLDGACDQTSTSGLVLNNSSLDTGAKLYATTNGLLTPNTSAKFEDLAVGRFIEFATNGSLVTTPNYLVAALNSPSAPVSSAGARTFTQAVFTFNVCQ